MNRSVPALAVLCLAALTACGGGGEPDNSTGEPRPSATRSEQAAPAERLAGLMVTPAEVKGFAVKPYDNEFALAKSASEMTADKPACAPLALALNQLPLGEPQADLTRVLAPESQGLNGTQTYVTLTQYASGGAQAVPADVKKAVDACGDGFTAKGSNGSTVYDAVTAEDVAPAGEETVGFTATTSYQGVTHTVHTQVVRTGDVVGVYFSADGMAVINGRASDAKLPPAVVKAQSAKLG
ncbi:hypothetical protein HTV80_11925 [Streptomyces sp. Vc74B-19]|uniref:hypothetical protein n=1 Tax=unclassified Streptomyces TaxID=2593676 RepID=UPI001BFCA3E3|nr:MULTISPECIES: hypothetical protein [unclassified Streptomyces]MBT3163816.1 hypothetical protein [Streptomyces sp. Vc74B-19]MCO4696404.1 hypothetical protein [Streptomyces sp. RO-S4]